MWNKEIKEPILYRLMYYLSLQDAGCPIGRHELLNNEWQLLGLLKIEREIIGVEKHGKKL